VDVNVFIAFNNHLVSFIVIAFGSFGAMLNWQKNLGQCQHGI
jgi:hypothetical protein